MPRSTGKARTIFRNRPANKLGLITAGANPIPSHLATNGAAEQYREWPIVAPGGLISLQIGFPRFQIPQTTSLGSLVETPLTAAQTFEAGWLHPDGQFRRFTSDGTNIGNILPNWIPGVESAFGWSDEMPVGIEAAGMATLKMWTLQIGTSIPYNDPTSGSLVSGVEGSVWGTSGAANHTPRALTTNTGGSTPAANAKFTVGPCVIRGRRRSGETVFLAMDSLGIYGGIQSNHFRNDAENIIGPNYAFFSAAVPGDAVENWLGNYYARKEIADMCDDVGDWTTTNTYKLKSQTAVLGNVVQRRAHRTYFNRKKLFIASTPPYTSLTAKTATITGSSIAANVLTLGSVSAGVLTIGMKLNVTGSPYITGKLTGTNYGDAGSTYSLSSSTGNGLTPTIATGQWADPAGADQTAGGGGTELIARNAALATNYPGIFVHDRYTSVNAGAAASTFGGDGTPTGCSTDGTHWLLALYNRVTTALGSALLAAFSTTGKVDWVQPSLDMTVTGTPTYSGGYCTSLTARLDSQSGASGKFHWRFIYNSTYSGGTDTIINNVVSTVNIGVIRAISVRATGKVFVTNASAQASADSTIAVNDGLDHVIEVFGDGQFAYLHIDDFYQTTLTGTSGAVIYNTGLLNSIVFTITAGRGKVKEFLILSHKANPTTDGPNAGTAYVADTSYIGNEANTTWLMARYSLNGVTTGIAGKEYA